MQVSVAVLLDNFVQASSEIKEQVMIADQGCYL